MWQNMKAMQVLVINVTLKTKTECKLTDHEAKHRNQESSE